MSGIWYYGRGTQQSGPMSLDELRKRLVQDGNLSDAYVWREGFETWKRVPEVAEVYPAKPPPLPDAPAVLVVPELKSLPSIESSPSKDKESNWTKVAGIAASIGGAVIGLGLSRTLGSVFWIPALAVCVAWWTLSRGKAPAWAIPMLAIVIGQTIWVAIGIGILMSIGVATGDQMLSLLDIVIVGALTFWVLKAQSRASCIGVLVFELIAFGVNVATAGSQSSAIAMAMTIHIILRLCGITACGYAIYWRRSSGIVRGVGAA